MGVLDRKAQIRSLGSLPLYMTNQGVVESGAAVSEQLATKGISSSELDLVLLSHLDCDHANGLRDVAAAKQILVSNDELKFAQNGTLVNRIRYNADWWAGTKIQSFDWNGSDGPAGRSYDVFGDGSLVTVNTPGHSKGHCVLKITNGGGKFVLMFADGGYAKRSWEELITSGIADDKAAFERSPEWIRTQSLSADCVAFSRMSLNFKRRGSFPRLLALLIQLGAAQGGVGAAAAHYGCLRQVEVGVDELLGIVGFDDGVAVRVDDDGFAGKVHLALRADTVAHSDEHAAVERLHLEFPLEHLRGLGLGIDGGYENDIRTHECLGAHALGIMAVKAHDDADPAKLRVKHLEAVVGGGVVILLEKLVRLCDMHHLLHAEDIPVRAYEKAGIKRLAVFAQVHIRHGHDVIIPCGIAERLDDGRGALYPVMRHILTRILREKLRQLHLGKQDKLRTVGGGPLDGFNALFEVFGDAPRV